VTVTGATVRRSQYPKRSESRDRISVYADCALHLMGATENNHVDRRLHLIGTESATFKVEFDPAGSGFPREVQYGFFFISRRWALDCSVWHFARKNAAGRQA